MIRMKIFLVVVSIYLCCPSGSDAFGSLMSTPESTNGVVTACPGDPISITCTHNITIGAITEWRLPGVSAQCLVVHGSPNLPICAPFTVTMVSGGSTLSSTVEITATEGLSGEVECLSGQNAALVSVLASINISVAAIPTPNITMVEQISQSMANVSLSVDNNTLCAATYVVNATQDGGDGSVSGGSSSTSPVTVDGLDVCGYSYSFVGFVITPSGVSGDTSAPYSFTADLSGVNGVSNVSTKLESTVLQWKQTLNTDYPDCITSYSIGWNGVTYNTTDIVTCLTRELLNDSGFPFCMNTSVTVTPMTPMGLLAGRDSTADVSLIAPDFVTPTISGVYRLSSTVMENNGTNITMNIMMKVFFGMVQEISQIVNTSRMIGYNRVGMACTPNIVFTGESFEVTLPDDADFGETFTMCVQLTSGNCREMASSDFTIPGQNITSQNVGTVSGTNFTVTLNLPITEYRLDQLLVITSLTPNDTAPVVANFSASYEYTVMFSGLMPGTSYTYTVRIVRRNDMTEVNVDAFVADFLIAALPTTVPPPPTTSPTGSDLTTSSPGTTSPQGGCTEGCIAGIIVGFLFVLVLVVVIIVIVLCYWSKTRKSGGMKVSHEMEEQSDKLTPSHGDQVDPISDSPPTETFKNPEAAAADKSPDVIPGNEDVDAGPDSNALIYADLEMATKDKNKAKVDATVTPTGGAEGHEAVEYASIEHFKKSDKSEGDEDN
ncbi:uncharacterized protein LOC135340944 isoform X1 [Halichondria panicea]|uniref:uncharacterized protein LOC135340944 isoform X1 n=1 Tax=Halichondria panicea TaxID=6063 RepID=UPI00312B3575